MTDEPTVEEQALALADEVLSLRARLRAQDDEIRSLRADNATLERKLTAALVDVVNMANQETSAALADEEALDGVRADNAALAAALEDIAGMLDWNRLESGQPEDWRATAECAGMNHVCHVAHPGDPVEWCGVCVAEVAWCAWKMGVLG